MHLFSSCITCFPLSMCTSLLTAPMPHTLETPQMAKVPCHHHHCPSFTNTSIADQELRHTQDSKQEATVPMPHTGHGWELWVYAITVETAQPCHHSTTLNDANEEWRTQDSEQRKHGTAPMPHMWHGPLVSAPPHHRHHPFANTLYAESSVPRMVNAHAMNRNHGAPST